MKFLDQMRIKGRRLLIRVDYNVPLANGCIQDDSRIRASIPTVKYAIANGAAVILCSHLGRPRGKRVDELSLLPVAQRLSKILQLPVPLASDCVGANTVAEASALKPGQILMLENLRFHCEEEQNDPAFSQQLADLADIYVNDAFAVAHRSHASVVGVTSFAKDCCAGFLMKKEWEYLGDALKNPLRPYVVVVGGAKISTKLAMIDHLLDRANAIIIGGAMANTFLLAQGFKIGKSRFEPDLVDDAASILAKAKTKGVAIYLPVDVVVGESTDSTIAAGTFDVACIPDELMALDVGPKSLTQFESVLRTAKTVMWNGPVGVFENPAFENGSNSVARTIADLDSALTIVGGGDTDALIHSLGLESRFSFVSTGGGSFLQFVEGTQLPAFEALDKCGC